MRASAKTEYACLALVKLAERFSSGDPVRIREIADDHGIPSRFLVQILLQLKGAGFVQSTRGATGGYQLSRAPEEITLADVVGIIEGPENQPTAASAIDTPSARALLGVWREDRGRAADAGRHHPGRLGPARPRRSRLDVLHLSRTFSV